MVSGFKVTLVFQLNYIFYFEILKWSTFHFQVFWFWWCVYISLIVQHLEDMEGFGFGMDGWLFYFDKSNPTIVKGSDSCGVFIFISS
jgi:hypothetical protein